jgi:prepilin-type N-terminal cleavage/methylation domain-containing protein
MKKFAFSLLELSIALIIIAVISAGILVGPSLIDSARLSNARSATTKSPVPNIEGLVAWYEASSHDSLKSGERINGFPITEWRDISPNSLIEQKNTLNKTADNDVTYQAKGINYYPSIKFDTSGKITLSSFYQGPQLQVTLFMVFRSESALTTNETILSDAHSTASKFTFGIKDDAVRLHVQSSATTQPGITFTANKNYITAIYFNDSASAAYVNNSKTMVGGANIDPKSRTLNGLTIGANKNGGKGFNGLISEVIIYDHPLKLIDRKEVMGYLSSKYQIKVTEN